MANKTVLYFVPHQDDELLTFGIDIATEIQNGSDVHIIVCTDGSRSGVRLRLNDGSQCEKCGEKHLFPITIEEFIATRDAEFHGCCDALGVKKENRHLAEKRIVDGSITLENAMAVMKEHLARYGEDVTVCTMYPNPPEIQHRDHRTLGLAAQELKKEGVIGHLKLMEEPYVAIIAEHSPDDMPVIMKASDEIAAKINNAIASYFLWGPANKRYAIGYHSVPNEMHQLKTEMALYYHDYQ